MKKLITNITPFILAGLLSSNGHGIEEKYEALNNEIKQLIEAGELKQAYLLSKEHADNSDIIAIQYAKFLFIMGKQDEGQKIFDELKSSKQISKVQKQNIDKFMRINEHRSDQVCEKGSILKAGKCVQEESLFNRMGLMLDYKLGTDSNVFLDNEEILSASNNVKSDEYQKVRLSTWWKADKETSFWLQPKYDIYKFDYFSSSSGIFDQTVHSIALNTGGEINSKLSWQVPLGYRNVLLDNTAYTEQYAIRPRLNIKSHGLLHQIELGLKDRQYSQDSEKDRSGNMITTTYGVRHHKGIRTYWGKIANENYRGPDDRSDAYSRQSLSLKYRQRLNALKAYKTYAKFSYRAAYSEYKDVDGTLLGLFGSSYNKLRKDFRQTVSLSLTASQKKWQISSSVNYQDRDSNLPLYKYNRFTTEVGFNYKF